jgi:hypothetical protein
MSSARDGQPCTCGLYERDGDRRVKRFILAAAAIALLLAARAPADEFGALPGLWKTTLRIQGAGKPQAPVVQWHCVAERASPWISFAQLDVPSGADCKHTDFVRTSTSLKWRLDCNGQFAVTNQGSITFDNPHHYTGKVTLTGTIFGYPIDDVVSVEGEDMAACTTPAD